MNSSRNPKSLRDFIEKAKLDNDEIDKVNQIEETLKNLKNLSQEEKTEVGLLRSRIDEQSRLIMILKQRGDEFIRKNMTLEKLNQELMDRKEELEKECKAANEKYKSLLDKFEYLANNHQELIKIKDDYKQKNVEVNIRYQLLVEKMKNVPSEEAFLQEKNALNERIENLTKESNDYQSKYVLLKEQNENFLLKLNEEYLKLKTKEEEVVKLTSSNEEFEQKNRELSESLEKLKEDSQKLNEKNTQRINELTKQNEELTLICENLKREKKIIFENQTSLEKNYKNVCQELNKFKETYNKDALHTELQETRRKHSDLEKQFDAYKSYATSLLEKEKELNNKLRFMIS